MHPLAEKTKSFFVNQIFFYSFSECLLKIDPNALNKPLILTQHMLWPTYKYDAGYLYMPKKHSILVVCQSKSKLNLFNNEYVSAYCKETAGVTRLEIEDQPYNYSDFKCTKEVEPQVKWTGKACHGDDSETVEIVFEVLNSTIKVFEVCMDLSTYDIPLYTKQNMRLPLADAVPKAVTWFNDKFRYDYDKLYDAKEQIKHIPQLQDHCVFSKRQLVNPLDVFPGVPQKATFTHLNVVPHWSTCSSKVSNFNLIFNSKTTMFTVIKKEKRKNICS